MKRKNIAIIATMILAASLMACETSNPADTTTNENVKVAVQSATTLEENQTEKPVVTTTDATTESTSIETDTTGTEITTDVESTDTNDTNNDANITSESEANVAESNESDYEVSYEPDIPAYVPDTTDTETTDTPADIPDSTPAEEPNAPAPAEPAVHEHNWTPTYCYIEWIASQTTSEDQYVPGGTVTVTRFEQAGQLIDHYECDCGATKDGENKNDIPKILSEKNVPEGGILYYTSLQEYEESLCKTLPSYSGYGQWHPPVGQW